MMRTHRDKPMLIALALVAALAMYAGLVRGPTDEEVLAEAVRSVAGGVVTKTEVTVTPQVAGTFHVISHDCRSAGGPI